MFLGKSIHIIDSKGRLKLPSKFIKKINEKLFINVSISGEYLEIISFTQLEKRFNFFSNVNEFNYDATEIKIFLNATTFEIKIDSAGRINIPQEALKNTNINKEVYVIGNGDKIIIWDKKQFNKKYNSSKGDIHKKLRQFSSHLAKLKDNKNE